MAIQKDESICDNKKVNKAENGNKMDIHSASNEDTKNKRKKLGRSARRRKAKLRAILHENQIAYPNLSNIKNLSDEMTPHLKKTQAGAIHDLIQSYMNVSGFPSDRSKSLPGVLERRRDHLGITEDVSHTSKKDDLSQNEDKKSCETQHDENNDYFDTHDQMILSRQLGFVPGNAICVVARENAYHKIEEPSKNNDENDLAKKNDNNEKGCPIVLKLYPLAIRDCYAGGKLDGRKFKSRKRGNVKHDEKVINEEMEVMKQVSEGLPRDNMKSSSDAVNEQTVYCGNDDKLETSQKKHRRRDWQTSNNKGIIEPFPTIFWLTCPKLRVLISRLETGKEYNVKKFENKLKSDPHALQSMREAHLCYGTTRWNLLNQEDREEVIKRGWKSSLGIERGVAGIRQYDSIKCLHTHAAHFLSGEEKNVVGKWVMEAVQKLIDEESKQSETS